LVDFRVSALEKSGSRVRDGHSIYDRNRKEHVDLDALFVERPLAHSYHTITVEGNEIHRSGKQGSATNYTK
jgi:hypothetical protein